MVMLGSSRKDWIENPPGFDLRRFFRLRLADLGWNFIDARPWSAHGDDALSKTGRRGLGFGVGVDVCRGDRAGERRGHGLSGLAEMLGPLDPADEHRAGGFREIADREVSTESGADGAAPGVDLGGEPAEGIQSPACVD